MKRNTLERPGLLPWEQYNTPTHYLMGSQHRIYVIFSDIYLESLHVQQTFRERQVLGQKFIGFWFLFKDTDEGVHWTKFCSLYIDSVIFHTIEMENLKPRG